MRDFRKILVWQKSHDLTLRLYKITSTFPKEELYGLTSQIRRASASIPTNIAEGCGRDTQTELARFIHIAAGSASELDYHLLLSYDLGYTNQETYQELEQSISEIKRMLYGFEKTVSSNPKRPSG
jgi:four helix bundle protein